MRIIVDPSTFDCLNMGDVAMLQVAIRRLRWLWPDAVIQVFTNDPFALSLHCPDTEPLPHCGRTFWFSDQEVLGRLHEHIPLSVSRALIAMKRSLRRRSPGFLRNILRWKLHLTRADGTAWERFLTSLDHADLYVVSGAATLNDKSKAHAYVVLGTIEMALGHGIPVAMFSQGFGPLTDPELLAKASRVLPRVTFIALRENLYGPTLLRTLGGRPERVQVTGDDAVESAYEARASETGAGIGVNLRVARSSDIEPGLIDTVRGVLHSAAEKYHAPLIPVPIASHAAGDDTKVIRQLLQAPDGQPDRAWSFGSPSEVIQAAGNCRIVITGAYHAAVFALAQGIPAVCLAGNTHYLEKFTGLVDQFPTGCELLSVRHSNFKEALAEAIERAWISADTRRPDLLAAAAQQVELSRAAYQHMADVLNDTFIRHRAAYPTHSRHSYMTRIAIIMDHPQRDLAGLVLTAFRLCQQGVTCHLVPLNLQDRELWALAPDFVLLNFARRGTEQLAAQLRNARIKYGVLDTEGGVWGSLREYSNTLWGIRSLLHGAECVCAWGPAIADHVLKEGFFKRSQVTVTGCPRFDLYHSQWRLILAGDSATEALVEPRKRILINTNFTFSNPKFASVDLHLESVQQNMGWSLARAMSVLSAGRAGLDATIEMVRNLSRDFPQSEIVLRPHPFEQGEYYRTRLATLENVSIDGNGSVQLQIYRADVVVQRSCTTAIEAGMASVPTLSPRWVPPEMEMPAAEEVSTACISYQDLRETVDEILAGCYDTPADTKRAITRVIGKWFYYADGLAHQRVADALIPYLNGEREVDERLCAKILHGVNNAPGWNFERLGRTVRYAFNLSPDWSFGHLRKVPSLSWATTNKFFGVEQVRRLADQVRAATAANGYAARPLRVEFARVTNDYLSDHHGHSITLKANG